MSVSGTIEVQVVYCHEPINSMEFTMARLSRSSHDKMLLGVCGGLAQRFGIDSTLIRVIFVIATVVGFGSPILLYFILAFIMPKD